MQDLIISLILTAVISIIVKLYFGESGLSGFPVLTFLVIAIASYVLTAFVSSLMHS